MSAVPSVIRVVGIGSPHGDDQIGWRLADAVRDALGGDVAVYQASTPLELLDHVGEPGRVIVVDACRTGTGQRPGRVMVVRGPEAFLPTAVGGSCHALGVGQALALAEALGRCCAEVELFAVEAGAMGPADDLSPELASALPGLADQLRSLVEAGSGPWDRPDAPTARAAISTDPVRSFRANSEVGP